MYLNIVKINNLTMCKCMYVIFYKVALSRDYGLSIDTIEQAVLITIDDIILGGDDVYFFNLLEKV